MRVPHASVCVLILNDRCSDVCVCVLDVCIVLHLCPRVCRRNVCESVFSAVPDVLPAALLLYLALAHTSASVHLRACVRALCMHACMRACVYLWWACGAVWLPDAHTVERLWRVANPLDPFAACRVEKREHALDECTPCDTCTHAGFNPSQSSFVRQDLEDCGPDHNDCDGGAYTDPDYNRAGFY